MNQTEYTRYLKSEHWQSIRKEKLVASGFRCEKCSKESGDVKLDVHHLTYERLGLELLSDLQVLCRGCHRESHGLLRGNDWDGMSNYELLKSLGKDMGIPKKKKREKSLDYGFNPVSGEWSAD